MTAARCPDMFAGAADAPRRRRRIMMHVVDAGYIDGAGKVVELECGKCGHTTGYVLQRSVSAEKRGRPCPVCNPDDPEAQALARDEEDDPA